MLRKNNFLKALFVCLFITTLLFVSCPEAEKTNNQNNQNNPNNNVDPNNPVNPGNGSSFEKNSLDYFNDNNIRAGINIGNTLDASSETGWGNPKVNQALLNGIKESGFNIVRIPVTWTTHIGKAPDYKIDEKWLERVVEIAGYANNAGIKAVIINVHHDGSSGGGWLSLNKALDKTNPTQKTEINEKFTKLWEQIATRFKDHGEWLIFEAFNEIHDGNWFWAGRPNLPPTDPKYISDEQYALVNEWAQVFTDTVRATGGNNAKRYLVIPSYCTGPEALLTDKFVLPTDSAAGKQIVSFHYYRPDEFSLNGKSKTWESTANKNDIIFNFMNLNVKFTEKNIQVIIGETGPVLSIIAEGADRATADANRISYINFFFKEAKDNSIVPIYWDNGKFTRTADKNGNGDSFGIYNRNTGKPYDDNMAAVIKAMVGAVK